VLLILSSSSSSAHHSPLLGIGLSKFSPSRSIFGHSHPAPASRPAQVVTPSGLRASYTTFTKTRSPLQNSFTPEVITSTADMGSSLSLQHANTVCYVGDLSSLPDHLVSDSIPQRNPEHSFFYSSLSDPTLVPAVPWVSTSLLRMSWPVERTDWTLTRLPQRLSVNPLVAFNDIHGRKREVLFFYFVPYTTRDHYIRSYTSSLSLNINIRKANCACGRKVNVVIQTWWFIDVFSYCYRRCKRFFTMSLTLSICNKYHP
jgi:hypothetical protein